MSILKFGIEFFFSIGLFINALLFVPQIISLIKIKCSKGLSLITFVGFTLVQFLTILHADIHRDHILMLGYIMSFVLCGFLTLLIIYYRKNKK